jgi:hydroxyacyl-ACP dehydratase HTD2-like protein with hotdog domain
MAKTCFTNREIKLIRELFFGGRRDFTTPLTIDTAIDRAESDKEIRDYNKVLFKLGFVGIDKDGNDIDLPEDFSPF